MKYLVLILALGLGGCQLDFAAKNQEGETVDLGVDLTPEEGADAKE